MLVPTDADVVEVPVPLQLFKPQLHQLFIMEVQRTLGGRLSANGELLNVMRQLLNDRKKKDTDSESSWNSARGPARGVRWRGGTPPQPPRWQYQQNDLRAFSKYERKVETWVMQSRNYMTSSEMGLALYVSLTGEAESEAEHFDLKKVNAKDGVKYILDELRGPLQQRILFFKNGNC